MVKPADEELFILKPLLPTAVFGPTYISDLSCSRRNKSCGQYGKVWILFNIKTRGDQANLAI